MRNSGLKGKRAADQTGIVSLASQFNQTEYLIPKITGYTVDGSVKQLDPAGGEEIVLQGSGFKSGATVRVDNAQIGSVTITPTTLTFTSPAKTGGTYTVYATNPNGGTAALVPGLVYDGLPTWSSPAADSELGPYYETTSINNTFVAEEGGDSITYSLFSGSLPSGATLDANTGNLTGTAPVDSNTTTYSFTIQAQDEEDQTALRSFTLTVNTDVVTWSSPDTSQSLTVDSAMSNLTLVATSGAGYGVVYTANSLPNGLSLSGDTISGTPTDVGTEYTLLTATANTTTRTATRTITWTISTASNEDSSYNTILLKADTSGANDTFVDSSTAARSITTYGDATQTGLSPYASAYSNYFDGSGDYIQFSNWVGPGTGDFTVECWIMLTGAPSDSIITATDFAAGSGMQWFVRSNYTLLWQLYNQNSPNGGTAALTQGQWYHVAWSRVSGTNYLFIDGNLEDTTAGGNSVGTTNFFVGGRSTTQPFPGYITNVRVLIGTGLYTSNFTVPTEELTEISNTSLIVCQGPTIRDVTGNYTAVDNGDVKAVAWSPFDKAVYTKGTQGGSGYFDGTGDYLTASASDDFVFGSGDFTVEAWVYPETRGVERGIVNNWQIGGAFIFRLTNTNKLNILYRTTSTVQKTSTDSVPANCWSHVTAVRNGNNIYFYINGVADSGGAQSETGTIVYQNGAPKDLKIGTSGDTNNLFNGYISDLRIVKGTAVYTSAFTPPTAPLTAVTNTKLLMNFTNASIYDAAQINNWTLTGDVVASDSETKYSSSSVYFDGNGDRIEIPWNPYLYNQTKPYTVEFWFYPTYNFSGQYVLGRNAGNFFNLQWNGSDLKFRVDKQGVGTQITASETCALNAWHHVAMTYDGTTTTLWINGTSAGTVSGTGGDSNTVMTIGYYAASGTSSFQGYIEDFRWTQGLARYTTSFTPPTSPLT